MALINKPKPASMTTNGTGTTASCVPYTGQTLTTTGTGSHSYTVNNTWPGSGNITIPAGPSYSTGGWVIPEVQLQFDEGGMTLTAKEGKNRITLEIPKEEMPNMIRALSSILHSQGINNKISYE